MRYGEFQRWQSSWVTLIIFSVYLLVLKQWFSGRELATMQNTVLSGWRGQCPMVTVCLRFVAQYVTSPGFSISKTMIARRVLHQSASHKQSCLLPIFETYILTACHHQNYHLRELLAGALFLCARELSHRSKTHSEVESAQQMNGFKGYTR